MSLLLFQSFESFGGGGGGGGGGGAIGGVGIVSPLIRAGVISSAVQLADMALMWSSATGDADLTMIDSDIASDRGLATAVALSLFTDRRAVNDDAPPSGDARDRRGWWADQFADTTGDLFGSRLWLLERATLTNETVMRAKEYVREALAWMIDDKVAAGIDITVEATDSGLVFSIGVQQPGRDPVTFRFAHAWDHLQEDT